MNKILLVGLGIFAILAYQQVYGQEVNNNTNTNTNSTNSTIKPKPECFSLGNIFDPYYEYTRCIIR